MSINYEALWNENSMSYEAYREIMARQAANEETSGPIQNKSLADYTALNERRMLRLDRKVQLLPAVVDRLKMVVQPQNWLVITETWCGDAAQLLPIFKKMADQSEAIDIKLIWRDAHLNLMDAHLTNGSRAIPKLIALNEDFSSVLGTWGARPRDAQDMVMANKTKMAKIKDLEERQANYQQFQIELQQWYNRDKGISTQSELLVEIEKWQL